MKLGRLGTLCLLTVVGLSACETLGLGGGLADEIRDRRSDWLALGITDYDYEAEIGCFCPPLLTRPHRVFIEGDEVIAALDAETGQPGDRGWFSTIDDLFVGMLDRLDNGAEVRVTFDAELHHPTMIHSWVPDAVDSGWTVEVRDLRIGADQD